MADDVVIRDFRQADLPRLLDIAVAAWTPIFASYRRILGDDIFEAAFSDWQADKRQQIRHACDPDSVATVLVAELGDAVVGFVTFYVNVRDGVGEIGNNAVHPDFQGMGIGPRMYARVFEQLCTRGMRVARVRTGGDPAHAPARRAYEKVGFGPFLPNVDYYRTL